MYTYVLSGTDVGGSTASRSGTVTVDTTAPVVSELTASPDPFSPKLGETTTISFNLSESAYAKVTIYNSSGTRVRTLTSGSFKTNLSRSFTWNGKTNGGSVVRAGIYTYRVSTRDKAGNNADPVSGTVTVE
jgi:flagellar hook assembly protein FlgD